MGTRWRGLLAPIDAVVDDSRRMRFKTFTCRTLPLAMKWQRVDVGGHDESVVVGSLEEFTVCTLQEAIDAGWITLEQAGETGMALAALGAWGSGEIFDDIDSAALPRMAEDVAEAKELLTRRVVAPSVDPIPVGAVYMVEPGSDEPITEDRWWQLMDEAERTGIDPELELLIENGLVTAVTLVMQPAFSEVRPFELYDGEPAGVTAAAKVLALTAAAGIDVFPADVFTAPAEAPPMGPVQVLPQQPGEDFRRVAGYAAASGTCHIGFPGICLTPPESATDYALFNRYPQNTTEGVVSAGRLTVGHGQFVARCGHTACRGNDDHGCRDWGMPTVLAHHDAMKVAAWVRAVEYPGVGTWVQGILDPAATDADLAVLNRRKVSGHWCDSGGNLEMVELLALHRETPGFPIPATSMRGGRQVSLIAAGTVPSEPAVQPATGLGFARQVADLVVADLRQLGLTAAPLLALEVEPPSAVTAAAEYTGAMIALIPSPDDAARLAVDGGEPVDQLHLTLAYLGEAATIPADVQSSIVEAMRQLAVAMADQPMPDCDPEEGDCPPMLSDAGLICEGFGLSAFNPNTTARDTAIVLTVGGAGLAEVQRATAAVAASLHPGMPAQHEPFAAHLTLSYDDDTLDLEPLRARANQPVTFTHIRCAFAGAYTDIPLGRPTVEPDADTLSAELAAALDFPDADLRRREADLLLAELDALEVG